MLQSPLRNLKGLSNQENSWKEILIDKKDESTLTNIPLGSTIHNIEITLGK